MVNFKTVRGVNDLFQSKLSRYNFIKKIGNNVCRNFCYKEIETPIFEFADLFIKPLGETSDIVTKENYIFEDRSSNSLMLRPEGTTSVVRALINAGLTQDLPQRFFYSGPMFRYERPQKGRLRQFYQFGVELLGVEEFFGDIEVILLANYFLKNLKIDNKIKLHLNSLGDEESRLSFKDALKCYLSRYKNDLSVDSKVRLSKNPLRILDSKSPKDIDILKGAPKFRQYLNHKSKKYFDQVCNGLDKLKIPFFIDLTLVRGLDYYSHTTFEFKTDLIGSQDTILAGGRYDGLSKMISNYSIPGVGWAAGIDRINLMLNQEFVFNPDVVIISQSNEINSKLLKFYKALLDEDIKTEFLYTGNIAKKLRKASKINSKLALIIGTEELKTKTVCIKNLKTGYQISISSKKFIEKVLEELHKFDD